VSFLFRPAVKVVVLSVLAVAAVVISLLALTRPAPYGNEAVVVATPTTSESATPSAPATPPKSVVFIGDSYAQGTGSSVPGNRWVSKLSYNMGWTEHNIARGGTGYLAIPVNSKAACGLDYCPPYVEMIPEAAQLRPDVVLVSGGRNDAGTSAAVFGDAADNFYVQLRTALPNARIIAVNPLWDATEPPASLAAYGEAVKAAVTAVGGEYLDVKQPLEGHPDWIISDGVHPADPGHTAIFLAVKAALPPSN
jgi:acyl-CoA thioesterase-1